VDERTNTKVSGFNLKNFWKFAASLKVDTKESDQITLAQENLLGTQIYMIEEIAKGIEEGVHHFVILKGRQLGITTISIALDLYWAMKHKGMSGSLVTHTEEAREMFRATITMYMESLPDEWRVPIVTHNRTQLVLKNRSRFSYQVAGTRKNSKLGKGQALTFLHATEVSEFGDEEGMASLEASLAENNPNRLFIYESTAEGMNHYVDMWENAKSATTQRAIFIGWWRHQGYRKKKGTQEYRVYWDGKLTHEERKWVTQVKKLYNFDVDDEQIAWWRWNLAEKTRDEQLMYQNFPPTEDYAFVMSGTNFFNPSRITDEYKVAIKIPVSNFRFVLRQNFEDTELTGCNEKMANLKIWDFPQHGGHYVIGADPAYGSSEWADRFCASVFRCYSDGMEQVAEFNTADCSPYQFAWVVCYLAGAYMMNGASTCMLNLEINGPGQAVLTEMNQLKRVAANAKGGNSRGILDVVANIQNFMYKRQDSFGAPSAYHTLSNTREKERMFNCFKDGFERGMIRVKSPGCIDEMKNIIREEGYLGAPGRGKDDRIVAAGLATVTWIDYVRIRMVQMQLSRENCMKRDAEGKSGGGTERTVERYLQQIGVGQGMPR
jgi:hypothetical protein